jgi:hypothetical protein
MFCNRRSDRLKILYWDRDGWAIWYKRLEAGTFQFPFAQTGRQEVAAWELGMLPEGIDPRQVRRRKRYQLPAAATGAERSPRGVAAGPKNWMFFGSDNGGRTAAVLTSLIATCKRLGIDPFACLRDIFARVAAHSKNRLEELLPDKWKAARGPDTS